MTLYGFDISNNNGANLSIAEIKSEGFAWCEAKVSQGNYFSDPEWQQYRDQANACGLPIIGYHYADASCSPASQAARFQNNEGGDFVMIDFEQNSGDITDYWALAQAFNAIGITVSVSYIPQWYWQQIGSPDLSRVPGLAASAYPISSAGYASVLYQEGGGDSGEGWTPYGHGNPAIWQFSDCALIDGSTLDADAFRGSLDDLITLLQGGDMTPDQDTVLRDIREQLCGAGGRDTGQYPGWTQLGTKTAVDGLASVLTGIAQLNTAVTQLGTAVTRLQTTVDALSGQS
jgi:hypothetical protein